jgi:predicted SAM-dependent methyltransferase
MKFFIKFIKSHKILLSLARSVRFAVRIGKKITHNALDRFDVEKNLMVDIGGGDRAIRHWKVLDYITDHYDYTGLFVDYNFDLTSGKRLPFADESVAFFYSSHTLEHIPQEHCQFILEELVRCLKKGGAARITVPDYGLAYKAFGEKDKKFFRYDNQTLEENFLHFFASYWKNVEKPECLWEAYKTKTKEELADYYTNRVPRESQKQRPGYHINWWTYKKLASMLKKAGFNRIYISKMQGSAFQEMRGLNTWYDPKCGFDIKNPKQSLFVEAVK